MFSSIASRFGRGAVRGAACQERPPGAKRNSKRTRRKRGNHLFATAPLRRPLTSAVRSDLTENAHFNTPILTEETQQTTELQERGEEEARAEEHEVDDTFAFAGTVGEGEEAASEAAQDVEELAKGTSVGEKVTIRVMASRRPKEQRLGAEVRIVAPFRGKGFLPYREFPLSLLDTPPKALSLDLPENSLPAGFCRRVIVRDSALIKSVRFDVTGDSPTDQTLIVSARQLDRSVLWQRLLQIRDLCLKEGESIRGNIIRRNKGGLVLSVAGYSCFLPYRLCADEARQIHKCSTERFLHHVQNTTLAVCVVEVLPEERRVVVDNLYGEQNLNMGCLRIGSLVRCRVRDVAPHTSWPIVQFGAFLQISGTGMTGLLHATNISQSGRCYPEELFVVGEEIAAVVLDIQSDGGRIALGTAHLEEEPGQILYDKDTVMANAPIMAERLRQELQKARKKRSSQNNHGA